MQPPLLPPRPHAQLLVVPELHVESTVLVWTKDDSVVPRLVPVPPVVAAHSEDLRPGSLEPQEATEQPAQVDVEPDVTVTSVSTESEPVAEVVVRDSPRPLSRPEPLGSMDVIPRSAFESVGVPLGVRPTTPPTLQKHPELHVRDDHRPRNRDDRNRGHQRSECMQQHCCFPFVGCAIQGSVRSTSVPSRHRLSRIDHMGFRFLSSEPEAR